MKCNQLALLMTLALTSELSLGAQRLPAAPMLVASESIAAEGSLFPTLLAVSQQGGMPGVRPALSQGLQTIPQPETIEHGPLTGKDRLTLFWNETYATPGLWAGVGAGAMVDQMRHTPSRWDWDGQGYTRRFASEYGQLATRNAMHDGLAAISRMDPRYVKCECQGTLRRTAHAVSMSLISERQDGRLVLNTPQIASAYGAGMVSTFWYPHQQFQPLVQGVQFGHEQMGEVVMNNLVQEFGADIQRRLHIHTLTARRVARPDDDD